MPYALIADLENSRLVKDRKALSLKLEAALRELQISFSDDWLTPITNAKGIDELSSALNRPDRAFDIASAMNELVWPERFRWSLGSGTIDIGLESGDAGALDGTAFHNAADGLRRAKHARTLFAVSLEDVGPGSTALIEAAALAHAEHMADWSPRQYDIVRSARAQSTQIEVAVSLGVSPQTVSQALHRAGFDTMERIANAIGIRLTEIGSELEA